MLILPGTIYGPARFGNWAAMFPFGWLPLADGVVPSIFADFTTEGGSNHYYSAGVARANFAALLSALGGTFSRGSTAYRTNASGLLESVASNALRFDYDPVTHAAKGILLEGARTNDRLHSGDMSDAYWTARASQLVFTPNAAVAPDGTTTAAKWAATALLSSHYADTASGVSGLQTFSLFAKAAGLNWLCLSVDDTISRSYFNLSNGTLGTVGATSAKIEDYGNGWYRCSVTQTNGSALSPAILLSNANGVINFTGDGSSGVYLWGGQEEAAAFASSYIPTTTTSATRAADQLYFPTSILSAVGPTGNATFSALITSPGVVSGVNTDLLGDSNFATWAVLVNSASTQLQLYIGASGTLAGTAANPFKVALQGNPAGSAIVGNGGAVATSASNFANPLKSTVYLGETNYNFFGWFKSLGVWKDYAASNAALQALTV